MFSCQKLNRSRKPGVVFYFRQHILITTLFLTAFFATALSSQLLLTRVAAAEVSYEEETEDIQSIQFEQAKEEGASVIVPPNSFSLPIGKVEITPNELLAASPDQTITVKLHLDQIVTTGVLRIRIPSRWIFTPPSGVQTTKPARLNKEGTPQSQIDQESQTIRVTVRNAKPGDVIETIFADNGIPAGTQEIQLGWRDSETQNEIIHQSGVVLYAPVRESVEEEKRKEAEEEEVEELLVQENGSQADAPEEEEFRLPTTGFEFNASNDNVEHPEPFITVTEGNPDRVAAAANSIGGSSTLFLSTDGGKKWSPKVLPSTLDAPGKSNPEAGTPSGDPMLAADRNGNIWYGELTVDNGPDNPSRIVVNRVDATTNSFQPMSVGLPARTNGQQDKNMMTIDNALQSPTYGRIYVTWSEPSPYGGVNIVISYCDSQPNPASCDNADNWSYPIAVTPNEGSYIYASVATGPNGKVYVSWWDYSSANAIRGATCNPTVTECNLASGWASTTVALLNNNNGAPIPFACPILAQPGGRVAPAPQIAVDHSDSPSRGLVYVTWGDLRPGSGTTHCLASISPRDTHLSWDIFFAATRDRLPSGNAPSTSTGTLLSNDATAEAGNSDDWFPSISVDQTTGEAWAAFYSTRTDQSRKTANYFVRRIATDSGSPILGSIIQTSTAPSNYSTTQCCGFGNDYGDYAGLAATGGFAFPTWTAKRGSSPGQVYVSTLDTRTTSITKPTAATAAETTETTTANRIKPLTISLRKLNKRGIPTTRRGQFQLRFAAPGQDAQGTVRVLYPVTKNQRKQNLLGQAKATFRADKTKLVTLQLNARGKKLLRQRKKLTVQIVIVLRSGSTKTQRTIQTKLYRR